MPDCQANPIFVLASGQRCGSTLLQRYLCSHPDVMIWGEHDGVLAKMFAQFDRLLEWEQMFGHQYTTFLTDGVNNFIPNMNPPREATLATQAQLVRGLWEAPARALGRTIWGFKEVLYGADMARTLRRLFPQARIIHLTRNIFECFISLKHEEGIMPEQQPHVPVKQTWTRARTLEFINCWVRVNRSFVETPLESSWFTSVTYEDLVADPEGGTRRLVEWLGMAWERFNIGVFDHKLYTDRHKGPDPRAPITRLDLTPDEVALVTTDEILRISAHFNYDMSVTVQNT